MAGEATASDRRAGVATTGGVGVASNERMS
jgi:hypothetical protein